MPTTATTSFVSPDTVQIRFKLGNVVDTAQTDTISQNTAPGPEIERVWQDARQIGGRAGAARYAPGLGALEPAPLDFRHGQQKADISVGDTTFVIRAATCTLAGVMFDAIEGNLRSLARNDGLKTAFEKVLDIGCADDGGGADADHPDPHIVHPEAARQRVERVELTNALLLARGGTLQENGNGIPGPLAEAICGMELFRRLQEEDGRVRPTMEYPSDPQETGGRMAGICNNWDYAATAAKLANTLKLYDAPAAAGWMSSALEAMAWAEAHVPPQQGRDPALNTARNLAAAELYRATGDATWHDLFKVTSSYINGPNVADLRDRQHEAACVYARTERADIDRALQINGILALERDADSVLSTTAQSGFGSLVDPYVLCGWGRTAQQPGTGAGAYLHVLLCHALLQDVVTADAVHTLGIGSQNTAFLMGLNMCEPDQPGNDSTDITISAQHSIRHISSHFGHGITDHTVWPAFRQPPALENLDGYCLDIPEAGHAVHRGTDSLTWSAPGAISRPPEQIHEPPVDLAPDIRLEAGTVRITRATSRDWQIVSFDGPIKDAVVVVGSVIGADGHRHTIQMRNMTNDSFEFRVDAWGSSKHHSDALDVAWTAGTAGTHMLEDGGTLTLEDLTADDVDRALVHRINQVRSDNFVFRTQADDTQPPSSPELNAHQMNWVARDDLPPTGRSEPGQQAAIYAHQSPEIAAFEDVLIFKDLRDLGGRTITDLASQRAEGDAHHTRIDEGRVIRQTERQKGSAGLGNRPLAAD